MKRLVELSHPRCTQEIVLTKEADYETHGLSMRVEFFSTHYIPTILAVLVLTLFATIALASACPLHVDRAEVRIKELYAKLKITKARFEHAKGMTAVDDLASYAAIVAAHAEGLKKFVPVFEMLYTSMSDAQKQNADTLFRHHSHMRAKGH